LSTNTAIEWIVGVLRDIRGGLGHVALTARCAGEPGLQIVLEPD